MKLCLAMVLFALLAVTRADSVELDAELAGFARRFQAAQPSASQLAIWKLDWEDHLDTALARAKVERRPVLFVHVTNITGPSNFGSGHC